MEISAKLVSELRAKTGLAMMECKKMLQQTLGDVEKAIEEFRKKGVKASITERAATEGRILGYIAPDRKSAALVEINCNTDFTAKSDVVREVGEKAAQLLAANASADLASNSSIIEALTEVTKKTGENVRLGKSVGLRNETGVVGQYLYSVTGKIGVLVSLSKDPGEEMIRDLCLHIIAKNPLALTREELPADVVAKEKEIAVAQAKESGKPQNIAEKIAEGKLTTFFKERVLLDQEFVRTDKWDKSVGELLAKNGVKLEKFVRLEVGQ